MTNSIRRRDVLTLAAGAAAWPIGALAQQRALPVIGYLNGVTESGGAGPAAAFRLGLNEQGFVDGRNVEILYRWANTRYERLPMLAAELVGRPVAVIAASGGADLAAKAATTTIPIVAVSGGDPVQSGLVSSLSRPGGNVTGSFFLNTTLTAKRLELLHEIVPAARSIGFLVNPTAPKARLQPDIQQAETAATALGLSLIFLDASTPDEIEKAFKDGVRQHAAAISMAGDPLFAIQGEQLAALAARYSLPVIYSSRETVIAGGLMSYGTSLSDAWRMAGNYVGRILKGEKAADLPVQQSTRIEMVLNLKTAKALGIEVPTATLLRATEVIE